MKRIVSVCGGVSFWLWHVSVMAQTGYSDSTSQLVPPGITSQMAPTLIKLGVALAVIVALIYLSVYMLKKLSTGKIGGKAMSGTIEVVDRHFLSPKKQLCLVKVDKKYLLVGITEQAVNLVADVSDQQFQVRAGTVKPEYRGFSFKRFLSEAKLNLPLLSRQTENPRNV